MRTTVRIDDDLLFQLRDRAAHEKLSLTQMVDRALRAGLTSLDEAKARPVRRFRQRTRAMGVRRVDLNTAEFQRRKKRKARIGGRTTGLCKTVCASATLRPVVPPGDR